MKTTNTKNEYFRLIKAASLSLLGMGAIFATSCASQPPAPIYITNAQPATPPIGPKKQSSKPTTTSTTTVGSGLTTRPAGTDLHRDLAHRTALEPVRPTTAGDQSIGEPPRGLQSAD